MAQQQSFALLFLSNRTPADLVFAGESLGTIVQKMGGSFLGYGLDNFCPTGQISSGDAEKQAMNARNAVGKVDGVVFDYQFLQKFNSGSLTDPETPQFLASIFCYGYAQASNTKVMIVSERPTTSAQIFPPFFVWLYDQTQRNAVGVVLASPDLVKLQLANIVGSKTSKEIQSLAGPSSKASHFVDTLDSVIDEQIRKTTGGLGGTGGLWSNLAVIYPHIPRTMRRKMKQKNVIQANDEIVQETMNEIRNLPQVKSSAELDASVNEALKKIGF